MKGVPAIDPTANVLKLVEEAVKRNDDLQNLTRYYEKELRTMQDKWMDSKDAAQALQNKTFENRIALIEKLQYESVGKSGVTDPMMNKLFIKLDNLIESQAAHKGEGSGRKDMLGWIIGGVMTLIAVITYLSTL